MAHGGRAAKGSLIPFPGQEDLFRHNDVVKAVQSLCKERGPKLRAFYFVAVDDERFYHRSSWGPACTYADMIGLVGALDLALGRVRENVELNINFAEEE